MKNIFRHLFIVLLCLLLVQGASAEEYIYATKSNATIKATAAGCAAASGYRYLDVNNVRARINTGGDMWWDLPGGIGAQYFIPKSGTATSMFSSSLWIGGLDINNQLKLAAVRFRQVGNDYWPGPLTVDGSASVDEGDGERVAIGVVINARARVIRDEIAAGVAAIFGDVSRIVRGGGAWVANAPGKGLVGGAAFAIIGRDGDGIVAVGAALMIPASLFTAPSGKESLMDSYDDETLGPYCQNLEDQLGIAGGRTAPQELDET